MLIVKKQKADRHCLTIRLLGAGPGFAFRNYTATGPRIFDPWRHHQMLLNALIFMSSTRPFTNDWRVVYPFLLTLSMAGENCV